MSYTPTTWETGDTITAEKLNNMEGGIAENDGYWIPLTNDNDTLVVPSDKRTEVYQALNDPKTNINGFSLASGDIHLSATVETHILSITVLRRITATFSAGGVTSFNYNGRIRLTSTGSEWYKAEIIPDVFTISLTPTSVVDFSGTIDRTQDEINEAYYNGQEIELALLAHYYPATEIDNSGEISCCATFPFYDNIVTNSWLLIRAHTNSDGTYSVDAFPLTPMS